MNTRDIEAFLAVVDAGSINAAAARLHLTQPAVTRRVQGLEEALGVQLLDRLSKPLKPTSAGHDAYRLGRRVLGSVLDLRSGFGKDAAVNGEFRLGVTPSQQDDALAAPLEGLSKAYPQLQMIVSTAWSHELVEQVESNRLDAALIYLPGDSAIPPTLQAQAISDGRIVVVAPKTWELPKRARLGDLAEHSWVLSQDGCGYRRSLRQAFARSGQPLRVAVEIFNAELRMALIARGLGLGLTTPALLERSRHRGAIDALEVRDFKAEIRYWLIHRAASGRLAAPLENLVAALRRVRQL